MPEQGDQAGRKMGNYRLARLLGKGGFADVYLGEHIHLNTLAAVKLLHTRLANDDVEKFRQEAQMIARLVHPHIVRVLDFGVEDNVPYLVMDYAPGGTLRQRHHKGAALPLAAVVAYVKQVADALQYAHDQRLIHRDVKPENMLLGRRGEVLLSDFGIALAAQSSNFQHTQNIAGTITYMAPEQIQAHPRPASDQYSLGIVAYEWLCGSRPFQGSFTEIAIKHALVPPPSLRVQLPALPAAVDEVVMIALQKDPHQRFPNVRAFALALEQASQQEQSFQSLPTTFAFPSSAVSAPVMTPPYARTNAFSSSGALYPYASSHPPASFYEAPYAPPLPSAGSFPYNVPSQVQPQRRFPRRALLAGFGGLAVAGGGLTWYIASRLSDITSPPSPEVGSVNPFVRATSTPARGVPILTYSAQQDYVWTVDWSPNGKYIVSGSHDGTTHVWTATTGQRLLSYRSSVKPAVSDDYAWTVAWSPNSKQVAIGFIDGTTQVVDIASGEMVHTYGHVPGAPIYAVTWSPQGNYLAAASGDNSVQVYAVTNGQVITSFNRHTDTVLTAAWSYDGKHIVSGSTDGKAKVWNPMTGEELLNYTEHSDEVRSVAWSHDSTRIVSTSWDHTAKVWEAATGHTLYTYSEQPTPQMMDVAAWSHNDKYIAIGSHDQYLSICEAKSGQLLHSIVAYPVYSLAWSPDDSRIVTGGITDKRVQVWKIQ